MKLHPLLTKGANKHYDNGEKTTIERLETILTVTEMKGACKFNIGKYNSREKDQNASDDEKADKYRDYLVVLNTLPSHMHDLNVKDAWDICGKKWSYDV